MGSNEILMVLKLVVRQNRQEDPLKTRMQEQLRLLKIDQQILPSMSEEREGQDDYGLNSIAQFLDWLLLLITDLDC